MKKIFKHTYKLVSCIAVFLFVLALTLALDAKNISSSAETVGSMQDTFVGTEVTYNAADYDDFYVAHETQGVRNWYIYGGSVDNGYSALSPIGDDPYFNTATYNIWKNDDNGATWNGIWWRNEFHSYGGLGVVAVWKAPTTGTIGFLGKIENKMLGTGYTVNVYKKTDRSTELIYTVAGAEKLSVNLSGVTMNVNKNEKILFELLPLSTAQSNCDFYIKPNFTSLGIDDADPQNKYENAVAGKNDTLLDNEYYKFSLDGASIPDSQLTAFYSNEQGKNNVYYLRGEADGAYGYMSWVNGMWRGGVNQIITPELDMTPDSETPDDDAILAYRATSNGLMDAYVREKNGSFAEYDDPNSFDGVKFTVSVRRYDKEENTFSKPEVLFVRNVTAGAYFNKTSKLTLEMGAGDLLLFSVNAKKKGWCDHYTVMSDFNFESKGETVTLPALDTEPTYGDYTAYYSKAQGKDGWYYAHGSAQNGYYLMDYDVYNDYWQNPEIDTFTRVFNGSMHAGYNDDAALMIKRIDRAGRIKLVSFFNKHNDQGDGVVASIWYNGNELYSAELTNIKKKYFVKEIQVQPGDIIILSIGNKPGNGGDNFFDMVSTVLSIEYLEETGEPVVFGDNDVGQLERKPSKPDDKLTVLDVPQGEAAEGGCSSIVSGTLLLLGVALVSFGILFKKKEKNQ